MDESLVTELHILNLFLLKNDFATTIEMNEDFRKSGIPTAGTGFQKVLDQGYLERSR